MALTEQTIIKDVTILPDTDPSTTPALATAQVRWADQVLKDGIVISEQFRRYAYDKAHEADFLAEVPNATNYISALGW